MVEDFSNDQQQEQKKKKITYVIPITIVLDSAGPKIVAIGKREK